jgi:hypothetical protein
MKRLNDEATIADGCTPKPVEVVLVEGNSSDAIYVDGKLVKKSLHITPKCLIRQIGSAPVYLTFAETGDMFDDKGIDWPENYADVVPYVESSVGY